MPWKSVGAVAQDEMQAHLRLGQIVGMANDGLIDEDRGARCDLKMRVGLLAVATACL
jgi:hypothetical protein